MINKFRVHIRGNVVAYLALFVALGGTSAWATHETILSSDIVNGEVKAVDLGTSAVTNAKLGNGAVTNTKLGANAVTTAKVLDNNLRGSDVFDGSLAAADIGPNAVGQSELANGAVTPAKHDTVPAARVVAAGETKSSSTAATSVEFNSETFDTAGLHDDAVDNSRLTAPISGLYQISAGALWTNNSEGFRFIALAHNGFCCFGASSIPGSADLNYQSTSDLLRLSAGDYVEVWAAQNSGSDVDIFPSDSSYFSMSWVGPSS